MPFDGVEPPLGDLAKFDGVVSLIETPGRWVKHTYRSPGGGFCLDEALQAAGIVKLFGPVVIWAAEVRMEREFCCIESFNDCPTTTHDDVVAVLHDGNRI